jgi:hypothetical protein
MQEINTDSFPIIWAGLTEGQQYSISTALIQEGCCTTRQTVWNWANGKTQPSTNDTRIHVARIVSKVVGSRVISKTLFPAR